MEDSLQSIFTSIIENASDDVREFLTRGEWVTIAQNIASKHNLSEEKLDLLKTDIIFSVTDPSLQGKFSELLVEDLEITPETADGIASDIRIQIFSHIGKPLLDEGNEHLLPAGEKEGVIPAIQNNPEKAVSDEHIVIREEKIPQTIHVPEKSAVEKKLAELRKLGQGSVLEARYSGQDPYREPLQ